MGNARIGKAVISNIMKESNQFMLKQFIHYYKPHKKLFFLDLLCAFIVSFCDLFYPMISGNMIDDYIPNQNMKALLTWSIVLLVIFMLKAALNYFIQYYGHCVGVRMQADMRRDVFRHMQTLPFRYFDANKTGTIMSRIINDLMEISELAHHGPEDLFISTVMLIGSFILLCTINLPLTLISFALIPLLVFFAVKMRRRMSNSFRRAREEVGEINANLENSISGIRVSKAFSNAKHEQNKFAQSNAKFIVAREHAYRVMGEFFSGTAFLTDVMNLVVLLAGGIYTYKGIITVGDFVKYILYINMFLNPIKKLINFTEQYQNGMTGFKRFTEIMETKSENEVEGAVTVESVKGEIAFHNVGFQYDENKNVLKGINLTIKPGTSIAFVGPSGGGKTTLCQLIPRFYDITEGKITIDGRDVQTFTIESLRNKIGFVQQDVFLFAGSIYDNISYGKLDATAEEIVEAAKLANIHEFIEGLEDGYDTYIGERGVKLSGGQKQRLSIARLILKNPPILILDEATSALDNTTEQIIQEALDTISVGKTTLVVAHRLSTIKNVDKIVVLTSDGIAEQGSHEDLMRLGKIYAKLYETQFANL